MDTHSFIVSGLVIGGGISIVVAFLFGWLQGANYMKSKCPDCHYLKYWSEHDDIRRLGVTYGLSHGKNGCTT